jgi:hypothetical protein
MPEIIDLLLRMNPWWRGRKIEERINGMTVHYVPIIKFLLKYSEILKEE